MAELVKEKKRSDFTLALILVAIHLVAVLFLYSIEAHNKHGWPSPITLIIWLLNILPLIPTYILESAITSQMLANGAKVVSTEVSMAIHCGFLALFGSLQWFWFGWLIGNRKAVKAS